MASKKRNTKLGFKTLLRFCVRDFMKFVKRLRECHLEDDDCKISAVTPKLNNFLIKYQKLSFGEDVENNIVIDEQQTKDGAVKSWKVESDVLNCTFTQDDLIKIKEIFEKLRKITIACFEDDNFPYEYTHFLFQGEERLITSILPPEDVDLIQVKDYTKYIDSYEGTWIPKRNLKRNAIQAIKEGQHEEPVDNMIKISSIQKHHYYVKPTSPFPDDHNFALSLLHLSSDEIATQDKDANRYKIPSFGGNNFSTLNEVIRTLFVEYFVEFGHFKKMNICNVCDSLYLENMENYQKYCSEECRIKYQKQEKEKDKDKSNCRERQRRWFKNHNLSLTQIPIPANTCDACDVSLKRTSGDCPVLWKKYGDDVLEWFRKKKGESAYVNECRRKQRAYFLKQINGNKMQFADRDFCSGCKECKNDGIDKCPEPGKCTKILRILS